MKQLFIWCIVGLIIPLSVTSQDSIIIQVMKENSYSLKYKDGNISGPAEIKLDEIGDHFDYFLVGENHGYADAPIFIRGLLKTYYNKGFTTFAAEIGPYTAKIVEEMAGHSDPHDAAQKHYKKYPWSIPFFSLKEDMDVVNYLQQQKGHSYLWGLDQEFAGCFRMLFAQLSQIAKSNTQAETAKKYEKVAWELYQESFAKRDPSKSILLQFPDDGFSQLKTVYYENKEGMDLINELETTLDIYRKWFMRQGYESNVNRASLMKHHFIEYKKQNKHDKVIGKFGANHIYKGHSPLQMLDIGNFVSEVAMADGKKSFHLLTVGLEGTVNAYNPFNPDPAMKELSYTLEKNNPPLYAILAPQCNSENDAQWIDLHPLRKMLFDKKLKVEDSNIKRIIWGYDAILVFYKTSAATIYDQG